MRGHPYERQANTSERDDEVCDGYPEHNADVHYNEADGVGWVCRRCGAEGWEPAEGSES